MADENKEPLTSDALREIRERLTGFARWVATSSGVSVDKSGVLDDDTFLGLSFVWSAIYDEIWKARNNYLIAESMAELLFAQEFRLPADKAKALAQSMRMMQAKKNIYDEVKASPKDEEADSKIIELLGVHNLLVAGTWMDFIRGSLVYEAWKQRKSELSASQYREIVNVFGGREPASKQLQKRSRAGCWLVAVLIALSVIGGVAWFVL